MALIKGSSENFGFRDTVQGTAQYAIVGKSIEGDIYAIYSYARGKVFFEPLANVIAHLGKVDFVNASLENGKIAFHHAENRLFKIGRNGFPVDKTFFVLARIQVKSDVGLEDKGYRVLQSNGKVSDVSSAVVLQWLKEGIPSVNAHKLTIGTETTVSVKSENLLTIVREKVAVERPLSRLEQEKLRKKQELQEKYGDRTKYHKGYLFRLLTRMYRQVNGGYPATPRQVFNEDGVVDLNKLFSDSSYNPLGVKDPTKIEIVFRELVLHNVPSAKSIYDLYLKDKSLVSLNNLVTYMYTFMLLSTFNTSIPTKHGVFEIPMEQDKKTGIPKLKGWGTSGRVIYGQGQYTMLLPDRFFAPFVTYFGKEKVSEFIVAYGNYYNTYMKDSRKPLRERPEVVEVLEWSLYANALNLVKREALLHLKYQQRAEKTHFNVLNAYYVNTFDFRFSDTLEDMGYTLHADMDGKRVQTKLYGVTKLIYIDRVLKEALWKLGINQHEIDTIMNSIYEKVNYTGELFFITRLFTKHLPRLSNYYDKVGSVPSRSSYSPNVAGENQYLIERRKFTKKVLEAYILVAKILFPLKAMEQLNPELYKNVSYLLTQYNVPAVEWLFSAEVTKFMYFSDIDFTHGDLVFMYSSGFVYTLDGDNKIPLGSSVTQKGHGLTLDLITQIVHPMALTMFLNGRNRKELRDSELLSYLMVDIKHEAQYERYRWESVALF